VDALMKR
jgi:hypothetical protein